jgi:hypothetical protein
MGPAASWQLRTSFASPAPQVMDIWTSRCKDCWVICSQVFAKLSEVCPFGDRTLASY